MNTKKRIIIVTVLIFLLCFPVSLLDNARDVYAISAITASELPTRKGDQVTGDDIVNVGRYLYGRNFGYWTVGTCTGFVTRVLVYLKVGKPFVSRNDNWYYMYTESNWDDPLNGVYGAWDPDGWLVQARDMVNDGTATYVGKIPVNSPGTAQNLGIQNGDILITPKGSSETGHVAIAYIDTDGRVKSFGATNSGIGVLDFNYIQDSKKGDTYVYRIAKAANGSLKVKKIDEHGKALQGASFLVTSVDDPTKSWTVVTEANGEGTLNELPYGQYTVTETQAPYGVINTEVGRTATVTLDSEVVTFERTNVYPEGSTRLGKYDADNRGATLGDATLEGATFELRAAETILEGNKQIYTKDQLIATVTTDKYGNTPAVTGLPIGKYYYKETASSEGFNINQSPVEVSVNYVNQYTYTLPESYVEIAEPPKYGNIELHKKLDATDYDPEINLAGARFKATLKSNTSQVYYSTISGADGICRFTKIPYGLYEIEEYIVPPEAEKAANFDVDIVEHDQTYYYTVNDPSKEMKIEIIKQIKVNAGEKTDAVVSGAEFTVYRDAACTNKVCVIGPTDANGYAISGTMRTGTYYIKETKFPTGIDPDAVIPGENVTYRNKVYSVSYDNTNQGNDPVTVPITIINEPKRNDLEIFKEIGKTTNTPQFPLDQCEFTATLKSSIGTDQVFSRKCTAPTDKNGYCIIEDLPYGEYVVEETKVSPISLKCENFDVFIQNDQKVQKEPYYKNIVDEPKVMQIKIRKVDANRKDTDAPDFTQGDATLEGAIYQIFRYDPQTDGYTEAVYEITVDHKDSDGYWCAESGDLLVGKYMVKEKISRVEYDDDGNEIYYSYAEGYLADPNEYYFDQQPDLQTEKRTYHYDVSTEEVIRGSVYVRKYDNVLNGSEDVASKGAILRLTLVSNPEKYYELVIDKNGNGEFVEEESRAEYYPYTIPYGVYELTEVKESDAKEHTSFFIQPETVVMRKQVQKEYRIESDEPVEMYIRVQKLDKDTGAKVQLAGAKFKIWDCQTKDWVCQMTYPKGEYTTEFETDETGSFTLPHKLEAGEYIVYETEAPKGYYLEDSLREPENKADLGNPEKGGMYAKIDKAAMGVLENTPANRLDLFYTVETPDRPLTGQLEIYKTGEMLTDASISATDFGEKFTPVYTLRGLAGVTFDIIAAEDIMSPDGKVTYVEEGTIVDTITTGEDGIARTKDLYLGEYRIVETVTPLGYVTDNDIENVTLTNTNSLKRVELTKKSINNDRQKLKISFVKEYEEMEYSTGNEEERYATFGVFSKNDIKNVEGKIVIEKDALLDVITVKDDEKDVTSTVDLPQGTYYIRELETSYPYTTSEEKIEITLTHTNTTQDYVTFRSEPVTNTYDTGSAMLLKISMSSNENLELDGEEVNEEDFRVILDGIISDIKGMTEDEIIKYLQQNDIRYVSGAKYKVYTDVECTEPLKQKVGEEYKEVELVSSEYGIIKLENIPLGTYYVKETEAPDRYELSDEVVKIELTKENKDATIYRAIPEPFVINPLISKVDIFTGEAIAKCVFEIKDENGKVLLHSITNEKGEGYIPLDIFENGKKYTYTEIEAPGIYNLNTEPHEFVAKFDENGKWITEKIKVENTRKDSTVTLQKLDFADSTAIPNCKFELRSLETDFVVEGVTDENGIYVFENIPYGKYTYTELEAPEEYMIDTEPHEITIDAEEIKIQVTNEKMPEPPETGDIQVVALAGILVISAVGMVYVLKNKKQLVK